MHSYHPRNQVVQSKCKATYEIYEEWCQKTSHSGHKLANGENGAAKVGVHHFTGVQPHQHKRDCDTKLGSHIASCLTNGVNPSNGGKKWGGRKETGGRPGEHEI